MDYTIGLEKQDITLFYEGIKTSCERLNRTMQNIALFENIKNNKFTAETVVLQKSKMFSKVFQ
jgi:two-component system sensor kinase